MTWTRQMAQVSHSTSQLHMAAAFHFFSENILPAPTTPPFPSESPGGATVVSVRSVPDVPGPVRFHWSISVLETLKLTKFFFPDTDVKRLSLIQIS